MVRSTQYTYNYTLMLFTHTHTFKSILKLNTNYALSLDNANQAHAQ